jgi:hypothetical protein
LNVASGSVLKLFRCTLFCSPDDDTVCREKAHEADVRATGGWTEKDGIGIIYM